MVTRNDVARLANVSPAVVSYVLNNSNYVSEEKRKAVLKAVKQLNYIPNQTARNLRQGCTRVIAVIRGSQLHDMFNELLYQLEKLAFRNDYDLVTISTKIAEDQYAADSFIDKVIGRHYDAVFVANSSLREDQINRLSKHVPVLLYATRDYHGLSGNISIIMPDYRTAVKQVTLRLLALGHRRICILPNMGYPLAQRTEENHRYAGYLDAFREWGLEPDLRYVPDRIASVEEVPDFISSLFDINSGFPAPTAICADEPFVLTRVLKQLDNLGLSVPKDVSLVSFSRSTYANVTKPEIAAMGYDLKKYGDVMMGMLLQLIEGKEAQREVIELNYAEGESVGASKSL